MNSDGWITVKERLPEEYPIKGYRNRTESEKVLVTTVSKRGKVDLWLTKLENGKWAITRCIDDILVLAWMPLPEAWETAYDIADYIRGEGL